MWLGDLRKLLTPRQRQLLFETNQEPLSTTVRIVECAKDSDPAAAESPAAHAQCLLGHSMQRPI